MIYNKRLPGNLILAKIYPIINPKRTIKITDINVVLKLFITDSNIC